MRIKAILVTALALVLFPSCSANRLAKPSVSKLTPGENAEYTVIGTMQNRDRVVTVKSGPSGIVYSIATTDGRSLFENIPAEKLRAQAPELHDLLETGTAGYAGLLKVEKFDARILAGR